MTVLLQRDESLVAEAQKSDEQQRKTYRAILRSVPFSRRAILARCMNQISVVAVGLPYEPPAARPPHTGLHSDSGSRYTLEKVAPMSLGEIGRAMFEAINALVTAILN